MPLLDFIEKEISGLKEKQSQVAQQIGVTQKELQRLQDTNLVVSGALQALTHVVDQHQKEQVQIIAQQQQQPAIPPQVQSLIQNASGKTFTQSSLQVPQTLTSTTTKSSDTKSIKTSTSDLDTQSENEEDIEGPESVNVSSLPGEASVEDFAEQDPFADSPDEEDE